MWWRGIPYPLPSEVSSLWQHFAFTARRAVASVTHRGSLKEPTALGLDQKSLQAKKIFFSLNLSLGVNLTNHSMVSPSREANSQELS